MIELTEVTKEYSKGVAALNGVNLKIDQGEFVFIVGEIRINSHSPVLIEGMVPGKACFHTTIT